MIHDFYHVLADNQAIGNTGAVSEDVLNWDEVPVRKGGHPRPLWFELTITTAVVGGAERSLYIEVQNAAADDGTFKTVLTSGEVETEDLTVGTVLRVPVPMYGIDADDGLIENGLDKIVRVEWKQAGGGAINWTAGAVHVALVGG